MVSPKNAHKKKFIKFFFLPLPPIEFRAGTHDGEKREVKRKKQGGK